VYGAIRRTEPVKRQAIDELEDEEPVVRVERERLDDVIARPLARDADPIANLVPELLLEPGGLLGRAVRPKGLERPELLGRLLVADEDDAHAAAKDIDDPIASRQRVPSVDSTVHPR